MQLTAGFTGQVDLATWDELLPLIDAAQADIRIILDPNQSPSLDPTDAGWWASPIDTSAMTTEQIGDDACEEARQNKADAGCGSAPANHELVGEGLRQLYWLLDDLELIADPG